jgi:hypothetical protein
MRSTRLRLLSSLGALALGLGTTPTLAVRPFVTDDARIIDRGQLAPGLVRRPRADEG